MATEDQATGYGGRSTKYKFLVFVGALVLIVSGYVGLTMTPYINQALPGGATATVSEGTKVASGATVPIKGMATETVFPIAVIAHTLQETPTSIVPVPTKPVVPMPTVVRNPYPPHQGKLVLNDPLQDNSKGYEWDEQTRKKKNCRFVDGVYDVLVEAEAEEGVGGNICVARSTNFSNFVFEMKVYLADYNVFGELVVCPGITFNGGDDGHYLFVVCSDGQYALLAVMKGSIGNFSAQRLTLGRSAAIHKGIGQANLLAVVANQQQFDLYINAQKVASVHDNQRSSGQIGCALFLYLGEGEVQCSNARVWEL